MPYLRLRLLAVPFLLCGAGSAALADTATDADTSPDLQQVVVTATKLDVTQAALTQPVSVVTAEQISAQAQTSVTDTLRQLPGIQFQVGGAPGQFIYPRLRGFSDSTLYVFDGITMNTGGSGDVGYLLGQLDPTMVQSIQVLRGPHATTYGANSTSGVLDFTTLQGDHEEEDISFEGGSLDWLKGRVGVQNALPVDGGTWTYSLNGSYVNSNGLNEFEFTKNGTLVGRTTFHTDDFEVGASFYLTDNRFDSAELIESTAGAPAPYFSVQIPDPSDIDTTKAGIVSLWFQQQLTANLSQKLTIGGAGQDVTDGDNPTNNPSLQGTYTAPYNGWTDPNGYSPGDTPCQPDFYYSPWPAGASVPACVSYWYKTTNNNYQADYNLRYHTDTIAAVLGASYLSQYYDEAYDSPTSGDSSAKEQESTRSVYGNASFGWFGNTLHTDVGARFDSYTEWKNKTTWSAGATYDIVPGFSLYANYGTSFTQPTLDELYDPIYGNKAITPENADTIEAGIRAKQADGALTETVTYWHSYVDNVITFGYDPASCSAANTYCEAYINENAERSQGVEAEFAWKIIPQLTLNGNYTRTDAYVDTAGVWSFMIENARNMGNLGLTWSQARFDVGTNLYMTDHRLRWAADYWAPGYARLDLFGRWHVSRDFDLYARVQNALDHDIVEILGYRNPGVYFVAGASYRFH